jgi:hypothetical protein
MRRLTLTMAALATIASSLPSDPANALPFSARPAVPAAFEQVYCRAPPWYRGWRTLAPWVCADYWWSPRFYYRGMWPYHRRHYRYR